MTVRKDGSPAGRSRGYFDILGGIRMAWEDPMGSVCRFAAALAVGVLLVTEPSQTLGAEDGFWEEVYEKNRVVEIDLLFSRDAWQRMQPRRSGSAGGIRR